MEESRNNNDLQVEIMEAIENLEERMEDVINVVQLLKLSMDANLEDEHLVRSVGIVERMVYEVNHTDIKDLKSNVNNLFCD